MTRVFAYIRVSTTTQAVYGFSLGAQKEQIKLFAAAMGYHVVAYFIDSDSAKNTTGRPEYQKMMARVDAGEVQAIISTCLDRFTRSLKDFLDYTDRYIKNDKAHLILIRESINTMSAVGRQMLPLLVAIAQLERERTSERVKNTIAHIVAQGGHYGKVPFGYKTIQDGRLKKLVKDPERWIWVQRMESWYRDGVSFLDIANRLNESGIKPAYSKKWTKTAVYDYLVNQGIHVIRSLKTDRIHDKQEAMTMAQKFEKEGLTQREIANRLNDLGLRPKKANRYEWYSVQTLLGVAKSYDLRDPVQCALAYRDKGYSLLAIGSKLSEHGHKPKRGGHWHATTVSNLMMRAPKAAA